MANKEMFLAILIIMGSLGVAISFDSGNWSYLLVFLYFAGYIIGIIRLFQEYRYFREWNAPPVTALFVVIPLAIGMSGSVTALFTPLFDKDVFFATLNLDILPFGSVTIFISYFSLLFLFAPYIIILFLLNRYFNGRYNPVYIQRRAFNPKIVAILYIIPLATLYYYLWKEGYPLEGIGLLSLLTLIALPLIYTINHVVFPRRQTRIHMASPTPYQRSSSTTQEQPRNRNITRSTQIARTNRNPNVSSRTVRTSNNYRQNRSAQRRSQNSTRPTATRTTSTVQIAPGIEVTSNSSQKKRKKTTQKNSQTRTRQHTQSKMQPIYPKAHHLTKDDFNCILCFQTPKKGDEDIVLCPNCRYPSHISEWQEWHKTTNLCSRCNTPISNSYLQRPRYVIPAAVYSKWIKKFK